MEEDSSLFEQIGGRRTIERVHKLFYDKLYAHSWLKHFFKDTPQEHIEKQSTDFMTSNMGGGKIYSGRLPIYAHKHFYITQEMFEIRHNLLRDSLKEVGLAQDLMERWLRIDRAFEKSIVKNDFSQCQKRFITDEIIAIPRPDRF